MYLLHRFAPTIAQNIFQVVLVMNPDMQADDALVVAVELDPLQLPKP
jgi:hypothetical protein